MRQAISTRVMLQFAGLLLLSIAGLTLFHSHSASAYGIYRTYYNAIEKDRMAQCGIQVYRAYGAAWINGTSMSLKGNATPNAPSGPGDARWSESAVNVAWNATSVNVSLWTDAYVCTDGSTQTGVRITNLKNAGSTIPISSFSSTTVYRGSASPGRWTDYPGPGGIGITLNLNNVKTAYGTHCYTVSFTGTYYSDQSGGFSGTYDSRVCIRRSYPPATLDGVKIDNAGIAAYPTFGGGTSGTFTGARVTVTSAGYDTANPFYFNDNAGGGSSISMGSGTTSTRNITLSAIPPGWELIGYAICYNAGCTTSALMSSTYLKSITPTTTGYTISNFVFGYGRAYHMRWIFRQIPPPQCGTNDFPAVMAVGRPYTFNVSVTVSTWPLSPVPTMYVHVNGPSGSVYSNNNQPYTESSKVLRNTTPITITPTVAGTYSLDWGISGFWAISCPGGAGAPVTGDAGEQPYLVVDGGDVLSNNEGIYGYNENGGGYNGASAQLAVLSAGDISGFVTGKGLLSTGIGTGSKLGFANKAPATTTGGIYGGQFAAVPDPAAIPGGLNPTVTNFNGNLSNITTSGVYQLSSTATLYGVVRGDTYPGLEVTIIPATGSNDIVISGNIDYKYNNVTEVPRLNLFTDGGNIIIDKSVQFIHGVLVAQSDSASPTTTGNVYTCGDAGSRTGYEYTDLSSHPECASQKLTIYGSVTASKLILGRLSGSWVPGRPDTSPSERILFSPEVWMHRDGGTTSGGGGGAGGSSSNGPPFDSYISLPPVL